MGWGQLQADVQSLETAASVAGAAWALIRWWIARRKLGRHLGEMDRRMDALTERLEHVWPVMAVDDETHAESGTTAAEGYAVEGYGGVRLSIWVSADSLVELTEAVSYFADLRCAERPVVHEGA